MKRIAVVCCLSIWGTALQAQQNPITESLGRLSLRFEDYPVGKIYRGPIVLPDFSTQAREFANYRSQILYGMKGSPQLAGRFRVIYIGCGTGCVLVRVGDIASGHIFSFPRSGEEHAFLSLAVQLRSRLILARWTTFDTGGQRDSSCIVEAFVWKGARAQSIKKVELYGAACRNAFN